MAIDILLTSCWEIELVTYSLGLDIVKIFATNCTPHAMNAELHPAFPFCFTIDKPHFVLYTWSCISICVKREIACLIILHAFGESLWNDIEYCLLLIVWFTVVRGSRCVLTLHKQTMLLSPFLFLSLFPSFSSSLSHSLSVSLSLSLSLSFFSHHCSIR